LPADRAADATKHSMLRQVSPKLSLRSDEHGDRGMAASAPIDARLLWWRFGRYRWDDPVLGIRLDVSRVRFLDDFFDQMSLRVAAALDAIEVLERGAIANADERRMVGHYWLRAPELAPTGELRHSIQETIDDVAAFAAAVRTGAVSGSSGPFRRFVHVGIGGSALGPQFLCHALSIHPRSMTAHFLDNADPDAVTDLLAEVGDDLGSTLISVVSKCGWTPTTQHLAFELEAAYRQRRLDFADHAVATTMAGTPLDLRARSEGWLARFALWDWVGGRTSATSAVGLLPAALAGVDTDSLLAGAAAMDELTRVRDGTRNPAVLLALMWFWLGNGRGERRMVILPYKDRLALLSRHVQQLVMESIGKRTDRSGATVRQGLTVFGHKGSSDQHSYGQQLFEGPADFFVTFVTVDSERRNPLVPVEPDTTLADFLFGYFARARDALYSEGRDSITISLRDLSPTSLGALLALYERAVGIYGELVNVNAYNQPAIEKDAAAPAIRLQRTVVRYLNQTAAVRTADEIAKAVGRPDQVEMIHSLLERLAQDPRRGIVLTAGRSVFETRFAAVTGHNGVRDARRSIPGDDAAESPGKLVQR
jgi:glucose-6-phosphate isomerase